MVGAVGARARPCGRRLRSRGHRLAIGTLKFGNPQSTIGIRMSVDRTSLIPVLKNVATRLRIDSLKSTSEAGPGKPQDCCSAAHFIAELLFCEGWFVPEGTRKPGNDRRDL